VDFDKVVDGVSRIFAMPAAEVLAGGKKRKTVTARSLLCSWLTSELGLPQTVLARKFRISQAAISGAVDRGRKLVVGKCCALFVP
jgi:hypothetical protein